MLTAGGPLDVVVWNAATGKKLAKVCVCVCVCVCMLT